MRGVLPLVDEALGVARVRGDDAAELVDPRQRRRGAPAVRGDHARVVERLDQVERGVAALDAHVVGVEDHPLLRHPADRELAELGQAERVAERALGIDRQDAARHELLDHVARDRVVVVDLDRSRRVVVLVGWALAGLEIPEPARRVEVAEVDQRAGRAVVAGDAGERVVELVRDLHLPDAAVVEMVDLLADRVLVAGGDAGEHPAGEGLGDLHAEDDGELALVDHLAGLERVGDDPVEALAGPARLRVDVVLQAIGLVELDLDGLRVVAVGFLSLIG